MISFENSYFEPEVRDGFYVPAMVKRAWAAELEVLSEIDKICRKHNIEYFADWGTLLATVRHEGFIPWDDDLDIVMKRADYKRFMEIAQTELPEGFAAYNYKNHDDFWLFLARVVGKQRICFEPDHLERFHEFPYIAGVDIFVLDYVSRDEEAEQKRNELAMYTLAIADSFGEITISEGAREAGLEKIERECGIKIPRNMGENETRRFLYGVVEDLFDRFSEEESDEMTQLFPFGMKNKNFRFSKDFYKRIARLPYENTTMPVPVQYDAVLKKRYGDYMKLVRNAGGHDYPFFESQHKQLLEVLDFEIPTYKFDRNQFRGEREDYKDLLRQCIVGMEQMIENLSGDTADEEMHQMTVQLLSECQQLAIDMGTLIESVKGEGTEAVVTLEKYCEALFNASISVETETITDIKSNIRASFETAKICIMDSVINRKTVVFLPYKADQWNYLKSEWQKANKDAFFDVFVVPVPYYYKRYDGSFMDMNYEGDLFPAEVEITSYEEVDLGRLQPDVIYIQNPYDEWNQVISLAPQYYSEQLQQCCNELVYVQSFEVEKFTKDNYREYFNMRDYVTVPGVVRADRVIVQSDWMRANYIDKLVEFAGDDNKEIWEKKIEARQLDEVTNFAETTEGEQSGVSKKSIVYGITACFLLQHKEQAICKLKSAFKTFKEHQDTINLIWCPHPMLEEFTKSELPEIWEEYLMIVEDYKNEDWGEFALERDTKALAMQADAYYGDSERMALDFMACGKPVMIEDVGIV